MNTTSLVMVGLVPTIHVFSTLTTCGVQNVDARHKSEHHGWSRVVFMGSGVSLREIPE